MRLIEREPQGETCPGLCLIKNKVKQLDLRKGPNSETVHCLEKRRMRRRREEKGEERGRRHLGNNMTQFSNF